jgi:hypothetical protein
MKNFKKEKLSIQKQPDELNSKAEQEVNQFQVDDVLKETTEVLKSLDYENKVQVIKDIIDKVIIKERRCVEVCGHISLTNQTLTEKLGYGSESWDLHHTVPYLEFEFEFTPPKPRYTRIILQRDEFGRIVHSKSPTISK